MPVKGRVIRPPHAYIDGVSVELTEAVGGHPAHGTLELPVGAAVTPGDVYRLELLDTGEAMEIRIRSYNDISTVATFEVVGDGA